MKKPIRRVCVATDMRLAAGVLSALVLVACGQAVPVVSRSNAGTTPSASAVTPYPTPYPTPPSPAAATPSSPVTSVPRPTLAGDLPVTTVDFSCRLPVVVQNPYVLATLQGAFITFPASQLANDPIGVMLAKENGTA